MRQYRHVVVKVFLEEGVVCGNTRQPVVTSKPRGSIVGNERRLDVDHIHLIPGNRAQ